MPAPPFLVGLSAGASLTAIVRVVSTAGDRGRKPKSSSTAGGDARGEGGDDDSASKTKKKNVIADASSSRRPRLVVKPKPFVRAPEDPPPDDPCPECGGGGRATCVECAGRGRTNYPNQAMLPPSAWPEWCGYCRGSGRIYCASCSGLGKKRGKIGFDLND
jgi:hypothetical protein